eukprot:TRINITY_DN33100_c0_g1_i1.p1 TRINITY_DN33100_c0_g1~~TRINITY_DN33100_c0_g1_i1.p1  ORF type:complete len:1131 (+),score=167.08 TRINITY_DN33100_c0_g1_i1:131-3394(+)
MDDGRALSSVSIEVDDVIVPRRRTQMAYASSDGQVHLYSAEDNERIVEAMLSGAPSVQLAPVVLHGKIARFEVRFGADAVSARMACPPSTGIIQVNLETQQTRVVRRLGADVDGLNQAEQNSSRASARFAYIDRSGKRNLFSDADNVLIETAWSEGASSVRLSTTRGLRLDESEVRFGDHAFSQTFEVPPKTGMLKVSLTSGEAHVVVNVSGTGTPLSTPGMVMLSRSRSSMLEDQPLVPVVLKRTRSAMEEQEQPPTPLADGHSTTSVLVLARELVKVLEASGPIPTQEAVTLVNRLHRAFTGGACDESPASRDLNQVMSKEMSRAVQTIVEGSMLKLYLPGTFGLGLRKHQCYIVASPSTGDIIWMKKASVWTNYVGEPCAAALESELAKLPNGSYKRERLVGVIPKAHKITTGAERSFVLALERTQLILVAGDVDTRNMWVEACFGILERRASCAAIASEKALELADSRLEAADVRMQACTAAMADAQATKTRAHAEANEIAKKAQAAARWNATIARARADEVAKAAQADAKAKEQAAEAAVADAETKADARARQAQAEAEEKVRAAAEEVAQAKAQADAAALAAQTQAQVEIRLAKAAAQARAEAAARAAQEEAAKAVSDADAAVAKASEDAKAAKEAAEAEKEAAARVALSAAQDLKSQAEALKVKAAADLKIEMDRGRAQLDAQIAAHGGAGLQLDEERTCVICYDDFKGYNDGVECCGSEPHFVCNECFAASVQSSISDEIGKQDLRGGRLACPFRTFPHTEGSCDAPCFDDRVVARKVDKDTFETYQDVRTKLLEARLAREADADMEKKIAAAIKKMEAEGAKVFQTQQFIVDDILTMRCPRCKMAFADWDGCNALYCTYAGCGCNFCAFCLKDCGGGVKFGQKDVRPEGGDAVHRHVNECKYAKGIGHGSHDRVKAEVWNKIREQRIEDCLKEKCDTVEERRKVVDNLSKHFESLGLKIVAPGGSSSRQNCPSASSNAPAATNLPRAAEEVGRREQNNNDGLLLPPNIKPCPACGILIEKIDGNEEVMCGCEAKPAGGTYEKALRGGGCGHIFNFTTLASMDVGRPGQPANDRQVNFR